jgi:hypothetical protein
MTAGVDVQPGRRNARAARPNLDLHGSIEIRVVAQIREAQAVAAAAMGIELHFPDYQFGRGLKVITVPWASTVDLIAPEFLPITR